jgi:hypothetical protein
MSRSKPSRIETDLCVAKRTDVHKSKAKCEVHLRRGSTSSSLPPYDSVAGVGFGVYMPIVKVAKLITIAAIQRFCSYHGKEWKGPPMAKT